MGIISPYLLELEGRSIESEDVVKDGSPFPPKISLVDPLFRMVLKAGLIS